MNSSANSPTLTMHFTKKIFVYPIVALYYAFVACSAVFLIYLLWHAIASNILDAPLAASMAFFAVFFITAASMIWGARYLRQRSKILFNTAQSTEALKASYLCSSMLKSLSTWLGVVLGLSGTASLLAAALIFSSYEFTEFLYAFNITFLAHSFIEGLPSYTYTLQACLAFPVGVYLMTLMAHVCAEVCSLVAKERN